MKRIYTAGNLPEAYLLLGLLEHAGIPARVLGESAAGGVGEIPFVQTWPEVWIDRDADLHRAAAVIAEFERGPLHTGTVRCRRCREENPAHFELCWHCGEPLDG